MKHMNKSGASISVRFSERELAKIEEALRVLHHSSDEAIQRIFLTGTWRRRLIILATWAVCAAIVRQGRHDIPCAVDLRDETAEESAERVGEELAIQIEGAAEPPSFDLGPLLGERLPRRWN